MAKKVLCVIDMQNDFITGSLGTPEAQAILPKVEEKIKSTDPDTIIIFTRDTHSEDYLNTLEGKNLPVPHCIAGTHGWEIAENLTKYFKQTLLWVVNKPTFGSTDLMEELKLIEKNYGEIELEFIGLCTGICVLSNATLARATFPDTEITVDSSCCACVSPESHKTALEAMKLCQITIK